MNVLSMAVEMARIPTRRWQTAVTADGPTVFIYNSSLGCVQGHASRGVAELFEHRIVSIIQMLRTTPLPSTRTSSTTRRAS
jgi:hypothetical protein